MSSAIDFRDIIFDFDGTLANTKKGVKNSVKFALKSIGIKKYKITNDVIGPTPFFVYKNMFGLDESMAKKAVFYHRKYSVEKAYRTARIYPGVKKTLIKLKKANVRLHIASLKKESVIYKILQKNRIMNYFDSIVGITDNETATKTDLLNSFIKSNCITNRALYVGDTNADFLSSKEVGLEFCFAKYGFGQLDSTPKYSINHFSNILDILSF